MKTFPLVLVVLSLAVFEPGSGSIITDANCLCPAEMVGTYVCGDELKSSDCFRNRAYNCTLPGKAVGSDMICSNVPCITNPNKRSATCTAYTVYVNSLNKGVMKKCEDCFINEKRLMEGEKLDWKNYGDSYLIYQGGKLEKGKPAEAKLMKRDGSANGDKFVEA